MSLTEKAFVSLVESSRVESKVVSCVPAKEVWQPVAAYNYSNRLVLEKGWGADKRGSGE